MRRISFHLHVYPSGEGSEGLWFITKDRWLGWYVTHGSVVKRWTLTARGATRWAYRQIREGRKGD